MLTTIGDALTVKVKVLVWVLVFPALRAPFYCPFLVYLSRGGNL
jgi:hypothetical protein